MSKPKTLCDWSKRDYRDRFDELCGLVAAPRHVCLKCGRAASSKDVLCKPKRLAAELDAAAEPGDR